VILIPPETRITEDVWIIFGNDRLMACGRSVREMILQGADGRLIPAEVSVARLLEEGEAKECGHEGEEGGEGSFVVVLRDITERKRVEVALLAAKSQAELANRVKTEFIGRMSHELRTPLNAIIGFSEILKAQMFGPLPERYRDYVETIYQSGHELLVLIDRLLGMARAEAGVYQMIEEEIELHQVVHECRMVMAEQAELAEITLGVEFVEPVPALWGDRMAITQVILSLIANGIRCYTPGSRLIVRVALEGGGEPTVSVRDGGGGRPGRSTSGVHSAEGAVEALERLLEPFSETESLLTRSGEGIGLSIGKSLMELHGGGVELHHQAGRGPSIIARFPLSRMIMK
jgi:signal transduction histidine kinase